MNDEEFILKFYSCDNEEQFLKDVNHNLNCLQKLQNNWNELKNSLKDELNTIKTTCSQVNGNYFMMNDKIDWLEKRLKQMQEMEQVKDE